MLISVIIPSFNHKRYVIQSITSVLDQTWRDLDLIVIDDGSTDGSADLIEQIKRERGGFRFVRRENRGLIKTLNQGLQMAKGKYVCELASDDYFPPDSIERRIKFFLEHENYVAAFADGAVVEGDKVTRNGFLNERRRLLFTKPDPIPDLLNGCLPVFSTCLFDRKVFLKTGGFDERSFHYYEDLEAPVRLCLAGKVGFLDAQVIYRREHESNTSKITLHRRVEKILCYKKFLHYPPLYPYRKLVKRRLRREYLKLARYLSCLKGDCDSREIKILEQAWPYSWQDPRLLWYLIKLL